MKIRKLISFCILHDFDTLRDGFILPFWSQFRSKVINSGLHFQTWAQKWTAFGAARAKITSQVSIENWTLSFPLAPLLYPLTFSPFSLTSLLFPLFFEVRGPAAGGAALRSGRGSMSDPAGCTWKPKAQGLRNQALISLLQGGAPPAAIPRFRGPLLDLCWVFFSRWFSLGLWIDFGANLTPTWAYVGSFFDVFWLLSWGAILKACLHRFVVDFGPLGTWQIKLPSRRESRKLYSTLLILSSLWKPISDPKRLPKSTPRGSKIHNKINWKFEWS